MRKFLLTPFVSFMFLACGGGDSTTSQAGNDSDITTSTTNTVQTGNQINSNPSTGVVEGENTQGTTSFKPALTNTGVAVEQEFNGFIIKVGSSMELGENNIISQSTIAIYGSINGLNTNSLLKLNTNYIGSDITVYVYKDDNLVSQSQTFNVVNEKPINFGEITMN